MMEELHTDSIDGGHEASYGARSRARERAYSNTEVPGLREITSTLCPTGQRRHEGLPACHLISQPTFQALTSV
jgi:hypothetical protein